MNKKLLFSAPWPYPAQSVSDMSLSTAFVSFIPHSLHHHEHPAH